MSILVCLTGIDGCGKGTHVSLLMDKLEENGHTSFYSKAYGDLEKEHFAFLMPRYSDRGRMFLFQAFHAEQYRRATEALGRGEIVVADRWDDAYLAYHGSSRSFLSEDEMREAFTMLNELAFRGKKADLTIMLDVPVDIAENRTRARGQDYFDRLGTQYHELMRGRYLELARSDSWTVLDGTQPVEIVQEQIWQHLAPLLSR